jgi:hypothetical protein
VRTSGEDRHVGVESAQPRTDPSRRMRRARCRLRVEGRSSRRLLVTLQTMTDIERQGPKPVGSSARPDEPMSPISAAAATPLRLLINSRFYITLEPYGGRTEPRQTLAAAVVHRGGAGSRRVHPAARDDSLEATDLRTQPLPSWRSSHSLTKAIPAALTDLLTTPHESSNNYRGFATACGATPESCCAFGHR